MLQIKETKTMFSFYRIVEAVEQIEELKGRHVGAIGGGLAAGAYGAGRHGWRGAVLGAGIGALAKGIRNFRGKLSPMEQDKFDKMTPEQKEVFMKKWKKGYFKSTLKGAGIGGAIGAGAGGLTYGVPGALGGYMVGRAVEKPSQRKKRR